MNDDRTPYLNPDVAVSLYSKNRDLFLALDDLLSIDIIFLCAGGRKISEIFDFLQDKYKPKDPIQFRDDILKMISECHHKGFLEFS